MFNKVSIMLKNKFMILAILPFMLSACGGGGSSDNNSANNTTVESNDSIKNGSRYYEVNYQVIGENNDSLSISYYEINNKRIYGVDSNQPLNRYIVTQNHLYTPQDRFTSIIDVKSMDEWTLNVIDNIKTDWKLEKVNLAGKNIFDTVLPGFRKYGFDTSNPYFTARKFLSSYGQDAFPTGSTCYRLSSIKNNQEFINFNTNNPLNYSFDLIHEDNLLTAQGFQTVAPDLAIVNKQGQFMGIDWTTLYSTKTGAELDGFSVIQYNGQVFDNVNYNGVQEQTRTAQIQFLKDIISSNLLSENPEALREIKFDLENLDKGCFLYNQTAVNKLESLKLINWNQ